MKKSLETTGNRLTDFLGTRTVLNLSFVLLKFIDQACNT